MPVKATLRTFRRVVAAAAAAEQRGADAAAGQGEQGRREELQGAAAGRSVDWVIVVRRGVEGVAELRSTTAHEASQRA